MAAGVRRTMAWRPQTTLTDRIDALADALRAAGVAPDRVATILASAATATMNALVLDAVLDEAGRPPVDAGRLPAERARVRVQPLVALRGLAPRTCRSRGRSCGRAAPRCHRDEARRRRHPLLARLLVQRLARMHVHVDADQVEQRARAHRPPAPCFMPASRSSAETRASSSTRTQSFSNGISTRLTTKPGVSWQRIGCLPSRSPNA